MMINIRLSSSLEVEAHHPPRSDKLRFMAKFLTWTKKSNPLEEKNCLILNFGIHDFQYNSIRKKIKKFSMPYYN